MRPLHKACSLLCDCLEGRLRLPQSVLRTRNSCQRLLGGGLVRLVLALTLCEPLLVHLGLCPALLQLGLKCRQLLPESIPACLVDCHLLTALFHHLLACVEFLLHVSTNFHLCLRLCCASSLRRTTHSLSTGFLGRLLGRGLLRSLLRGRLVHSLAHQSSARRI